MRISSKQNGGFNIFNCSSALVIMISTLFLLIKQSTSVATNPIFVTTLPNFQVASWVLITTNPVTLNGCSYQNTNVNYLNMYTSVPNIGIGIDFLTSTYLTTTSLTQLMLDVTIVQKLQSTAMLQLNRSQNSVTQISLNYVVCDSSFFLDIRHSFIDLSTTTLYTPVSILERTATVEIPYKTKSNSSNAQVIYNVIGIYMLRQSNLFEYQITTASKLLSSLNLSILVGGSNRLKWLRVCTYSYELIANSVDPPYYIEMGIVDDFSGTFPDRSGLTVLSYGTFYTGMIDWNIDDSNSVLNYKMGGTGISYLLTSTSLSRSRTAFLWYRKQSCPQYTFLNGHLCQLCHYTCLTCTSTSQSSCLTCPSTRQYISTNHSCTCITNYINANVSLCVKLTCHPTCLTCKNLNQCGTCDKDLNRKLIGTQCTCKEYTLDVYQSTSTKFCYPCHFTCLGCSKQFVQTACLTCNSAKDHRFHRASNNTCACMDKYYQALVPINAVCQSCHFSCAKCTSITSCAQCNVTKGRVVDLNSQFCMCANTYYDDLLNEQCMNCPVKCLTCKSLGCLTCNLSLFRQLSSLQCICMSGYFDDGVNTACQKCNYTCSTCNSLVSCNSCNNSLQRYMNISSGVNQCFCGERYYSIVGKQECMPCHLTCVTCNGANEDNCSKCDETKYRQRSTDNKCVCTSGYYQFSTTRQLCQKCQYTCQTCENQLSCLTCNSSNHRSKDVNNKCKCINGYYDYGNQLCLKCDYRCLTCKNSATCLTCDLTTRNSTNLSDCVCAQGYWDNGITSICQPCLAQCLTCLNGNNCTACPSNKVLTQTLNCICKSKTFQPNCLSCSYECQQCTNTAVQCTKCNGLSMRRLNTTLRKCDCYEGYFNDGTNQLCKACHYSCKTCNSYSQCESCPTNRLKNGSLCSCIGQLYENNMNKKCNSCHYSCKTCVSYSECTSCDTATRFRQFPLTMINLTLCQCLESYYDNGNNQLCYSCDPKCLACSSYSECKSCSSALNRYFVPLLKKCDCLDTYFEDSSTFLCQKCQYSCKTCVNQFSCLSCLTGRHLATLPLAYCLCDNGTFDGLIIKTCQLCAYPCIECSGASTICTSCDPVIRNFISQTSQCQCKTGTFQNGTTCQSCLIECQQCRNKISCTVCKSGAYRNLDGNNLCPCIHGYHDQNSTLLICQKCHYSCLTCTQSSTCLTCFNGRIPIVNLTCACPLNRFYDDLTNGACIPCHYSCLTCSSFSNNCMACSLQSNRELRQNKCTCKLGYFDKSLQVCVKCHYTCKSCVNSSVCTNCQSAMQRVYKTGPLCQCLMGKYDDGSAQLCQTCSYQCQSCTSTSTQCLTCVSSRVLDSGTKKCPCLIGLYDIGLPLCSPCLYSCKQCANSNQCTSCPISRYLQTSSKQCLCNNGLYNIQGHTQCSICDKLCLTCINFDQCQTCDTTNDYRYLVDKQCKCESGYFDDWINTNFMSKICLNCHYSCDNCQSATHCSSCATLDERIYNVSTKLCSCKSGHYDDQINAQCLKCPFDCLTCSDADNCLTCAVQRTLNTNLRCQCAKQYYENDTNCQKCPPECLTCINLKQCLICNGQRILSTQNKCICPVDKFMVINTALCLDCQYTCQTCISLLKCSTCNATNKRFLSGAYCKCQSGYYDDNFTQVCKKCHQNCKTCTLPSKCSSCQLTVNRILNNSTQLCQCRIGYYQDITTKKCIQCHYTCVACQNGSACQSCNLLHNRKLNIVGNQCQCSVLGFFDDHSQSACQVCDYKCEACQNIFTKCTSCKSTAFRTLQVNKCSCKAGYFDNNAQKCSKCSYKCLTCEGQTQNCTTCSNADQRISTPLCQCSVGFYDDGIRSQCKACDYRCSTCSDGLTCLTCDSTTNRTQNQLTKMCQCLPFFYDNGKDPSCVPCAYSCVTCSHPTFCLKCPATRLYKNGICQCRNKYYNNLNNLQCLECHFSCNTCTNITECSSCSFLNNREFNTSTKYCQCARRYYDTGLNEQLCLRCHHSCLTCINSTHCQSCPSNLNKVINKTLSNYCTCQYGFYQNIIAGVILGESSKCMPCHHSCQRCINQSYVCLQCQISKKRYLTKQYQCLCNEGYFDDGINQQCKRCASHCLQCWGSAENQCLTCDNSTYFLNNTCFEQCPEYYLEFINPLSYVKVCVMCTAFCLKCTTSQIICEQCQSTHRLFKYNDTHSLCIDQCPQFYYEDQNKQCQQCLSPCYHCTAKYQCIDCISVHYLQTFCYKCHPYCYACSGPTVFDCITCINGYYLDNGLCRKITCGQYQYVHSLNGCVDCSTTYPYSLKCDAFQTKQCKENFMLQRKTARNGTVLTNCKSCYDVQGYKMIQNLKGQKQCVQICGDGITINDLCDDGNTLNGDGCSQSCKIQKNWICINKTKCTLKHTPQISISKIIKVPKKNQIQIYIQLTIGLRLIKQNFLLQFSSNQTKFSYVSFAVNTKYTQYRLLINYYNAIQSQKIRIKVISPIQQLSSSAAGTIKNRQDGIGRRLQQAIKLDIPLQISLQLQLQAQILTHPPSVFVDLQTRHMFSSSLVYIFLAYQILCLVLAGWMLYRKIKFMLLIVDLFTSMRIIYVLCTFGMHKISDLLPSAAKGIQPFIYTFGPEINNINSPFYQFNYSKLIFSSCIVQLCIILVCLAIKYLFSSKGRINQGHYYLNAFICCCSVDIYLSCIGIFSQTQFQTFVGSYSWAVGIVVFVFWIMHNFIYIAQGKHHIYKHRAIVPMKSFVTSQLDPKQRESTNTNILEISQFNSNNNQIDRPNNLGSYQGQICQQNYTSTNKSHNNLKISNASDTQSNKIQENKKTRQTFSISDLINTLSSQQEESSLYDLLPSFDYDSTNKPNQLNQSSFMFYESTSRSKLTLYHLPVLNSLLPLLLVLIATLFKEDHQLLIRSALLFAIIFIAFVFIIWQKPQPIKSSIRNIKLIINYLIYLVICGVLVVATATQTQNHSQWVDISILCTVLLLFLFNVVLWIANLKYSSQYKEHLVQLRNQQIIERNKIQNSPRKRIYTSLHQNSHVNSPIRNIFRRYPNKDNNQELHSNSISQINSLSEQKSYYNRKANNIFENDQIIRKQSFTAQQMVQNYQVNQIPKRQFKQVRVRALNGYDVNLKESDQTDNDVQKQSLSGAINRGSSKQKITEIQKTISKQLNQRKELHCSDNQQQEAIDQLVQKHNVFSVQKNKQNKMQFNAIDDSLFISQNKRIPPTKVSSLSKLQKKQLQKKSIIQTIKSHDQKKHNSRDNIARNKTVKQNSELTFITQDIKQKHNRVNQGSQKRRIEDSISDKLLIMTENQLKIEKKENKNTQKHYVYKNASKISMQKRKQKSNDKQSPYSVSKTENKTALPKSVLQANKVNKSSLDTQQTLKNQKKQRRNQNFILDKNILELDNTNTRLQEYADNETNARGGSREKQTKLSMYTAKESKKSNENYFPDGTNQQQKTLCIKNYLMANEVLKNQQSDGFSNELDDDLSETDYELQFQSGVANSRLNQQLRTNQVFSPDGFRDKKPKKLKKSSNKRISPSKKTQQQRRTSTKFPPFQRQQLQQISSIHVHEEQPNDIYKQKSQPEIQQNIYDKILKDHQKYKNKKVDKKLLQRQLKQSQNNINKEKEEKQSYKDEKLGDQK